MLTVSEAWHNASKAQFRYQAYLQLTLELTPPGLREGATVTANSTFPGSSSAKIMDASTDNPTVYGTLEPNRMCLDGNTSLMSESTATDDWWSNSIPSADSPISIEFVFDQTYSIPGIYVKWDKETNSWPSAVTLYGYNASDALIYTINISDINSVSGFFSAIMDDVKRVVMVCSTWNTPNWRGRIDELMFGLFVEFNSINNGRIKSATQIGAIYPLSDSLPTHTMDVTFRNIDKYFDPTLATGVAKYIANRQEMKARWGFVTSPGVIEYSDMLSYIVSGLSVPTDSQDVTISLDSRLALLTQAFKRNTYTGTARTLFDIATYIFEQSRANIVTATTGLSPWIIPDSLKNFSTLAPIVKGATNSLLQLIALASCTFLNTESVSGYIEFQNPATDVSANCAISEAQELGDANIEIQDRLRSITIGVYHYSAESSSKDVGKFEGTLAGTNIIEIQYSVEYATSVSAAVTGATLSSAVYYASYAVLTISAAAGGASVTIALTGTELKQTITYVPTFTDADVADGKDIVVENPFVTDSSQLTTLTNFIKKYYQKRNKYSAPYIGYPQLEAGDHIHITTIYGESDIDVTKNQIDFSGAWSGTAEGL